MGPYLKEAGHFEGPKIPENQPVSSGGSLVKIATTTKQAPRRDAKQGKL